MGGATPSGEIDILVCSSRQAPAGNVDSASGAYDSTPGSLAGPAPRVPVLPVTVTVIRSPMWADPLGASAVTDVTLLASALIASYTPLYVKVRWQTVLAVVG